MPENSLLTKLDGIRRKYETLQQQLSDPSLVQDMKRYITLNKEYAEIGPIIQVGEKYKNAIGNLASAKELLLTEKDEAMREYAKGRDAQLEEQIGNGTEKIKFLLIPADPQDSKNAIMEIRAGTGDEASIFAGDLFRMYTKYAEKKDGNWRLPVYRSTSGGFKEIIFKISGTGVYGFSNTKAEYPGPACSPNRNPGPGAHLGGFGGSASGGG